MEILKMKTPEEISQCIAAQEKLCSDKQLPHFAPGSGRCWKCNRNIYQNVGWKKDGYGKKPVANGEEADFITGISLENASKELVTGCPHCNRSYCD
jgi:hypothetical protein